MPRKPGRHVPISDDRNIHLHYFQSGSAYDRITIKCGLAALSSSDGVHTCDTSQSAESVHSSAPPRKLHYNEKMLAMS